eukprot:NODE_6142_length_921_cov_54.261905_g5551_i0.p1 GENE.NODE_6142_length_921_cov_54.261905_g5551_i0~~NODE_6142_length_921_cov_54.261905_g5551_i0.p1  ORF type:complete len:272 (-),score=60.89 NODE_6142_length_921_cov_54.261905_g5551_i0:106-867(-)
MSRGYSLADTKRVYFSTTGDTSEVSWALGALTYEVGSWDERPEHCYLSYDAVGITDSDELLQYEWIRANLSFNIMRTNEVAPITLNGIRPLAYNVWVKISSRFQDCRGTAPGSPEGGRAVTNVMEGQSVGMVGPVTRPGHYRVCFKHRQDWEITTIIAEVTDQDQDILYYGAQTCKQALVLHPEFCGCYLHVLAYDPRRLVPSVHRTLDVPASLLLLNPKPHIVNQGCCSLAAINRTQNDVDGWGIWGMCKLT